MPDRISESEYYVRVGLTGSKVLLCCSPEVTYVCGLFFLALSPSMEQLVVFIYLIIPDLSWTLRDGDLSWLQMKFLKG